MSAGAEPLLDHLVYATADLEATFAAFERATGVRPAPGGRHPGRGTRNYLVGFSDTAYLEIIGPDRESPPAVPGALAFGIDRLTGPRLVTWAVRPADLDTAVVAAREAGADHGSPRPMSRATPSGDLLSWRLAADDPRPFDGVVPFLIDWGSTPHPARSGLPRVELTAFEGSHPDPDGVSRVLQAIDVTLPVTGGTPGLRCQIVGPGGSLELS